MQSAPRTLAERAVYPPHRLAQGTHVPDSQCPGGGGFPLPSVTYTRPACPSLETHLQNNGKLLRGVSVLHAHCEPYLEGSQLLSEEWAVLGGQRGVS